MVTLARLFRCAQGIVLASTFAVSHNVPESKPLDAGPAQESLTKDTLERDWGVQQLITSANWGGVIGNFFTGGLNLQVGYLRGVRATPWERCVAECMHSTVVVLLSERFFGLVHAH